MVQTTLAQDTMVLAAGKTAAAMATASASAAAAAMASALGEGSVTVTATVTAHCSSPRAPVPFAPQEFVLGTQIPCGLASQAHMLQMSPIRQRDLSPTRALPRRCASPQPHVVSHVHVPAVQSQHVREPPDQRVIMPAVSCFSSWSHGSEVLKETTVVTTKEQTGLRPRPRAATAVRERVLKNNITRDRRTSQARETSSTCVNTAIDSQRVITKTREVKRSSEVDTRDKNAPQVPKPSQRAEEKRMDIVDAVNLRERQEVLRAGQVLRAAARSSVPGWHAAPPAVGAPNSVAQVTTVETARSSRTDVTYLSEESWQDSVSTIEAPASCSSQAGTTTPPAPAVIVSIDAIQESVAKGRLQRNLLAAARSGCLAAVLGVHESVAHEPATCDIMCADTFPEQEPPSPQGVPLPTIARTWAPKALQRCLAESDDNADYSKVYVSRSDACQSEERVTTVVKVEENAVGTEALAVCETTRTHVDVLLAMVRGLGTEVQHLRDENRSMTDQYWEAKRFVHDSSRYSPGISSTHPPSSCDDAVQCELSSFTQEPSSGDDAVRCQLSLGSCAEYHFDQSLLSFQERDDLPHQTEHDVDKIDVQDEPDLIDAGVQAEPVVPSDGESDVDEAPGASAHHAVPRQQIGAAFYALLTDSLGEDYTYAESDIYEASDISRKSSASCYGTARGAKQVVQSYPGQSLLRMDRGDSIETVDTMKAATSGVALPMSRQSSILSNLALPALLHGLHAPQAKMVQKSPADLTSMSPRWAKVRRHVGVSQAAQGLLNDVRANQTEQMYEANWTEVGQSNRAANAGAGWGNAMKATVPQRSVKDIAAQFKGKAPTKQRGAMPWGGSGVGVCVDVRTETVIV